jgi:ribonuclease-3
MRFCVKDNSTAEIEQRIGYRFQDAALLQTALTHASLSDHRAQSNERLEFLGDAVLGLVVCEHLFRSLADSLEGDLTKVKSYAVSRQTCAEISIELRLHEELRLGKGMGPPSTLPSSVSAAVLEAVIGAIYLDGGLEPARQFILRHIGHRVDESLRGGHQFNFKSVLQQTLAALRMPSPSYVILDEKGPDHAKCFEIAVVSGERRFTPCWGASKKSGEQAAAQSALRELGVISKDDRGIEVVTPISPRSRGGSGQEKRK